MIHRSFIERHFKKKVMNHPSLLEGELPSTIHRVSMFNELRCPKFRNYDISSLELGIVSPTKPYIQYRIILASQAHILCKSSKGLTGLTVSLVDITITWNYNRIIKKTDPVKCVVSVHLQHRHSLGVGLTLFA